MGPWPLKNFTLKKDVIISIVLCEAVNKLSRNCHRYQEGQGRIQNKIDGKIGPEYFKYSL